MKEIIYILLENYADHEMAFLSQAINADENGLREKPKYVNKIAAVSMNPVKSIGGFKVLPDYTLESVPNDYAALVLIGGYGWQEENADKVKPLVQEAVAQGKIVGAICNAASWMAKHGFLNQIRHTGNGLEQLKAWGGMNYSNEAGYVAAQAVSDHSIVTANGTGQLEFSCELQKLLHNETLERIEMYYMFNKLGFVDMMKKIQG